MLIKLPNGFYDGPDYFNHVVIDELRGKQQNYLIDKELVVGNIGHIPKILEDMILEVQTKSGRKWNGQISELIWKLPVGDLTTILVKVREKTYGPRFPHEEECTHCGHINKNLELQLDKLEIDYLSQKELKSKKVVTLADGTEVEFKPLFLNDLFDCIKIGTDKQDKLVTATLAVSIARIGDNTNVTETDIDNMSMRDIMKLNEEVANLRVEGSIDTDIEVTCQKCNKDFKQDLNPFAPDFFVLSKVSLT